MPRMRDMQASRIGAWTNFDFFSGMTQGKWPLIAFNRRTRNCLQPNVMKQCVETCALLGKFVTDYI